MDLARCMGKLVTRVPLNLTRNRRMRFCLRPFPRGSRGLGVVCLQAVGDGRTRKKRFIRSSALPVSAKQVKAMRNKVGLRMEPRGRRGDWAVG